MNDRRRLFALVGISLALRLLFLGTKSLWIDECLAWGAARMGFAEMFHAVVTGTPHPPLAFIVMKLSMGIFPGEFGLRFLVALAGASAVIPVFRLAARRSTAGGGFYAALLWAMAPYAVSLGQEGWVYGMNAAISLWFADAADLAWRGSSRAYRAAILLGVSGILTQHVFLFSIAAGSILYFSVPGESRIPLKRFLLLPLILALLYAPVFLYFSSQFMERSARMARAGMGMGFERIFSLQPPSQYLRLLAGGMLPEITPNLLERPRMLAAWAVNALTVLALGVYPLARPRKADTRYLWAALLLPLALFMKDAPGIRQLAVVWIPFSITSAWFFSRYRYSGPAVCILCGLALIPYYRLDVFPYHRSNWREAVSTVESMALPGDGVVLIGGKSTSLAWEIHSRTGMEYFAHNGNTPFAGDLEGGGSSPAEFLDSLLSERENGRLWVVLDEWGVPDMKLITGENTLSLQENAGEDMQTGLVERAEGL